MLIDLRKVAPGDLPNEVFDELLAGSSHSQEMVEALRDHLVNGLDTKAAINKHGLTAQKFKMRLEKLNVEIQRVGRITALLLVDAERMDRVFILAHDLAVAVEAVRSNASRPPLAAKATEKKT